MLYRRARVVLVLGAAAMLLGACGGSDGEPAEAGVDTEKITLYSGRDEELISPLVEKFTEATGIQVDVRYGSSAEMAAQLLEEDAGTPADVFYSQEVGAVGALAKADLLSALPASIVDRATERFRPGSDREWVGVTARSRVIVYNPDLVKVPPAGVGDLSKPEYHGATAWVPGNAGFQAFVTAFRVSQSDAAAKAWLEAVKANGAKTYESNGDVLEAVNNGTQPLGLINHYYWARLSAEVGGVDKMKAQLVFPRGTDPGGLVNATAVGITKSGADNSAAQRFVEYLLSDEGQQYFVEETYEYPVVAGNANPAGIPALDSLQGPQLDLTDLDSLQATQTLLTSLGLLS